MPHKMIFYIALLCLFFPKESWSDSYPASDFSLKIGPGDSFAIFLIATDQNPVAGFCQQSQPGFPLRNYASGFFDSPADAAILDAVMAAYFSGKKIAVNYNPSDSAYPCHVTQVLVQ